ncbi:uncharacterized [Tachysurus ichikawai]
MAISPGERFATSVCRSDCRSGFEALSFSGVPSLSQESEVEVIIVGTPIMQQQTGKADRTRSERWRYPGPEHV